MQVLASPPSHMRQSLSGGTSSQGEKVISLIHWLNIGFSAKMLMCPGIMITLPNC